MMNNVTLIGRLTKDVELRYTQSGTAVASFTVAVNRNFTNQNGEREADFINAVIWRQPAELFSNFTSKGSQVGLTGRLQTRSYENNQGQRVYITEVVVENFDLLESKAETEARKASQGQGSSSQSSPQTNNSSTAQNANNNNNNNSSNPKNSSTPFNFNAEEVDNDFEISDDDLPF